jgi:hypothetical protein
MPEAPPPPAPIPLLRCAVCHERMTLIEAGQTTHPGCDTEAADAAEDLRVMVGAWNASDALMRSIMSTTKHPIVKTYLQKDQLPWTLFHEKMDGQHHEWVTPRTVPLDATISVLDRNKSYLSTASGVTVAPNQLTNTGALTPEQWKGRAGIFLIEPIEWPHLDLIGHPLGWTAHQNADDQGRVWITTPHLEKLISLHKAGDLPALPVVADSWTGVSATNLFRKFGEEAKDVLASGSPELIAKLKDGYSKAIRCLWPKEAFSDIWRPDYHQSFEAEAEIRNWSVAWKAVKAGGFLVRVSNTDATEWVSPADADGTWVAPGYRLGTAFGEVHHKDDLTLKVLGADGRPARRDGHGVTEVRSSPLAVTDYQRRVKAARFSV